MKDPVKCCKLYKESGCSHVDGPLCNFDTCKERLEHELFELEQQLDIPSRMRYRNRQKETNMEKTMIGFVKLSDLRRMMEFWFMGRKTLTKPEAETMLLDVLRTVGIGIEDDIVSCMKCTHRDLTGKTACLLDDPNDGSAACFRYDHFEPKQE